MKYLIARFKEASTYASLSSGFVKCFTDAGLDWGGVWAKPDGMHFQLKKEEFRDALQRP